MENNRPEPYSISCVVPAYNEGDGITDFLRELHGILRTHSGRVEIIVVNDGSSDQTAQAVAVVAEELSLTLLDLSRNFGKEAAITAGLARTRGDVVLIIDADGQEPLAMIGPMLERWQDGCDMVYAVRDGRSDEQWLKRLGTGLFYSLLARGGETQIPPDARDFRAMDRRVVNALNRLPERNRFMKGLFAWVGFHSCAVPVTIAPRRNGRSSYGFGRLSRLAMTGITSFTNVPLRIWAAVGLVISALAFAYGGYIVLRTLFFGVDVPGFATLVVSIMFLAGVQLISIGVIGEYLSRVFDEVKQRPLYLVATELDHSPLREREPSA